MTRRMSDRLVSRTADYDARCQMCSQMILGMYGRLTPKQVQDVDDAVGRGEKLDYQHPLNTIDHIVKVDGKWVHADCARDAGYEVI